MKNIFSIIGIIFGILGIFRYIPMNIGTSVLFICMGIDRLIALKKYMDMDNKKLAISQIIIAIVMIITGILWYFKY